MLWTVALNKWRRLCTDTFKSLQLDKGRNVCYFLLHILFEWSSPPSHKFLIPFNLWHLDSNCRLYLNDFTHNCSFLKALNFLFFSFCLRKSISSEYTHKKNYYLIKRKRGKSMVKYKRYLQREIFSEKYLKQKTFSSLTQCLWYDNWKCVSLPSYRKTGNWRLHTYTVETC